MVVLNEKLYELMLENIEDKTVRERVFAEKVTISEDDQTALCSALETDINYWENCIRHRSNEKECILNHIRNYIRIDRKLMDIFHR